MLGFGLRASAKVVPAAHMAVPSPSPSTMANALFPVGTGNRCVWAFDVQSVCVYDVFMSFVMSMWLLPVFPGCLPVWLEDSGCG